MRIRYSVILLLLLLGGEAACSETKRTESVPVLEQGAVQSTPSYQDDAVAQEQTDDVAAVVAEAEGGVAWTQPGQEALLAQDISAQTHGDSKWNYYKRPAEVDSKQDVYSGGEARAELKQYEFRVDFETDSYVIDPLCRDNSNTLALMKKEVSRIVDAGFDSIVSVSFCGTISPDGSMEYNERLAQRRCEALEVYFRRLMEIPDGVITSDNCDLPWETLRNEVAQSSSPYKKEILRIIDEGGTIIRYKDSDRTKDSRLNKLKKLHGGAVWKELCDNFFPDMRYAKVVLVVLDKEKLMVPEPVEPEPIAVVEEPAEEPAAPDEPVEDKVCLPQVLLKTNALGWALSMSNVAAEFDLTRHLSFVLPVYFSSTNYFTNGLKFRLFAVHPELRYWVSPCNEGFFAGAHFGMAYYNFAFKGEYRYQDHNRETPTLGGGVSLGYRMPLSKKHPRWKVEFAVGGGVYNLYYDKFVNVPNGIRVGWEKKTYIGLDQAAVSFAYSFDLVKKGGKR